MWKGFDIGGRVAVVTGGTSGLGRAIALGMAEAGGRVFAGSRSPGRVAETREALQSIGAENDAFELEVADPDSVQQAFETVVQRAGRLDILVHAAGITHRAPAFEMTLEDWERVLRVNLTGTFLCCQAAGRIMREQPEGGAIIVIASLAGFRGWSLVAAYGASKAGVVELAQTLATEWAPYHIRVNAIAPGVFPTPLNRPLIEGTPRGNWFRNHTPMLRFGSAEELVGAAIFLASPAASFITGETLAVDGGFLACGVPAEPPVP
jgi:NAD(P)-dependent dehydrogenase (short-subunit alcohol dehydrogenase family)